MSRACCLNALIFWRANSSSGVYSFACCFCASDTLPELMKCWQRLSHCASEPTFSVA